MSTNLELPLYVLDTHTLYWYWNDPTRLGADARRAFGELEAHTALGYIPTIVLLEIDSLMRRRRQPLGIAGLIDLVDRSPALRLDPLTREHLVESSRLSDVTDFHDRIIASASLLHGATLVTRDLALRAHGFLQTAW